MKETDKQETIATYNTQAAAFSEKFTAMSAKRAVYLDRFLVALPGKRVLDVGAGDGAPAVYLQEKGCKVVCVDLSEAMVQIMKSKGLDARLMDMEKMDFADAEFDGILALSSLMNLPKEDLKPVVENIARMLKPGGIFGSFITKGEGEGMEPDERYGGTRWFSHYSFEELKAIFEPLFEVVIMEDAATPARPWIFTLCRKR